MSNKQNDKGQWKEVGSDYDSCFEMLGCLIQILLSGIGCIMPVALFVVVAGFGVKTKPVQTIGGQMVARVHRLRNRPGKQVRVSTTSRTNLSGLTFS